MARFVADCWVDVIAVDNVGLDPSTAVPPNRSLPFDSAATGVLAWGLHPNGRCRPVVWPDELLWRHRRPASAPWSSPGRSREHEGVY